MKIGMSLLVCDSSFNLILSNVLYHLKKVDYICCIAHKPSKLLVKLLNYLQNENENFYYLARYDGQMTLEAQVHICNTMTKSLRDRGCEWVIPADDDEFYVGDIRECIKFAKDNTFNVVYQKGFCFYSTELDTPNLNPCRSMTYRDPDDFKYNFCKAIHRTDCFERLSPGNHWVKYTSDITQREIIMEDLVIHHYSYRKKFLFEHVKDKTFNILKENDIKDKNLVKDISIIDIFDMENIP